jgi:hypothetical protein
VCVRGATQLFCALREATGSFLISWTRFVNLDQVFVDIDGFITALRVLCNVMVQMSCNLAVQPCRVYCFFLFSKRKDGWSRIHHASSLAISDASM